MATSPLGGFANLAPAQMQVAQNRAATASPLDALLQAFTQGQALQQLPQMQAEQVLSRQLNNALLAQKLQDIQNPNAAISREFQRQLALQSLNPISGLEVARPGDETLTVATPGAVNQTEASLNQLLANNPSAAIPSAALGAPITPVINPITGQATGLTRNPNIGLAAESRKQTDRVALANARLKQQGIKGQYQADANGDLYFLENPMVSGEAPKTTKVETPEGAAFKPQPKTTKGGADKGLTANQQSNLRLRGGKALVDINEFTDSETGVVDWNRFSTEVGKAEGNKINANNLIKDARASAKTTLDEKNLQIYGNRMAQANADFDKITQNGFDPTSLGASGLLGSWSPNLLKTSDRQVYEQAERNFINSALRRESGAVITEDEFANARKQYFPQPGDAQPVLDQKAANRKLVVDEFIRLGGPQSGVSSPVGTSGINPNASNPVRPTGLPKIIRITPSTRR